MSVTKVNSSLFGKFKKTQVNNVQKLLDITGHTIGEFHIKSRLDIVSGEADIYLCSGTGNISARNFLLKYYRRENAVKPDVLEKLKGVNSPFVAPVEGFGEYHGHQYVVRPYYQMSAISELLAEGTRFSEEELKTYIIPSIIEGLKVVHDAGILHKDLKPANLIPDDAGEHIVLIDFGISSDAGNNTFVVTQTGMTTFYAAPEAMQGIFHKETDYYALGITVFELFTGFTPFQNPGLSPEDVARLAAISKIEFPENFPADLKKLVLGLTYKDISHRNEKDNPNRRWGYDEVKRWLKGEDVPVPGETGSVVSPSKFFKHFPRFFKKNEETTSIVSPSNVAAHFPPYRFNGITCRTEDELIRELLVNPEQGIRDLGRGVLTHHYFAINEKKGELCEKAEKLIEHSDNKIRDFVDFLSKLAPGFDGFGVAVFGKREYEFKSADAFLSYIDGLAKDSNYYELHHLFKSYGKALKLISSKTWPSDAYRRLEKIAAPIIQFGERIFRDDMSFAEYLEEILSVNKNTPFNLKNFVTEHKSTLSKLKERPALSEIISRVVKFGELKEPENAVITLNGIKYPAANPAVNPISVNPVKKGDFIKFGRYPQSTYGNTAPIEWLVLDVADNEVLLISRYGLDCKQYHHEKIHMTWENCDLRKWLNQDFLKAAFSEEEVERIKVSELRNGDNPKYNTGGGNITKDQLFCLSLGEAELHFAGNSARLCKPSEYACTRQASCDGGCYFWLRSPGSVQFNASCVTNVGAIDPYGNNVNYDYYAVRPAFRLILN